MTTPGRPGRRRARASRRPGTGSGGSLWPLLGASVVALLAVVDVVAVSVVDDEPPSATNIAGTLALAPALTGAGGTRRQTLGVGVLAVAVAWLLVAVDDVHTLPAATRVSVVALGAVLAVWVAHVRIRHAAQLQDRREAARTLQAAMLTELPQPDHLELACRYLPASSGDQVGGDWYDAVVADSGTTLVIGDVMGHDVGAAADMGQVRAMLRAYAVDRPEPPSALLCRLERSVQVLGLDVLATAVVARVEQTAEDRARGLRRLRWSNAGHPPPLLLHADGRVEVLDGEPDLMLGVDPDAVREDGTCELPPGSTLLLYTDGLVERRDATLEAGVALLARELAARAGQPLAQLLDGVLGAVLGEDPEDDVAVLAVRAHPEDRPRPQEAGPTRLTPGPPPRR
ncbi:stage II sporulation protein E [Kineococcus xinjiangensis]|uniref:protein-serine/threonine phosphatase n=1 Tax=Kineococcus xinjiangensis TaxID=512762 RepID=A0A2S6IG54_9ACTN|nr:PP2C family protein-serine/threonine phosphatase [Kineococcus xinjiangensis]PPK93195.1 stage II sporulation protein E [Kineococcus xinjiangensis]